MKLNTNMFDRLKVDHFIKGMKKILLWPDLLVRLLILPCLSALQPLFYRRSFAQYIPNTHGLWRTLLNS